MARSRRRRRARNRPDPAPELRAGEAKAEARACVRPEPAGFDEEHWTSPHNSDHVWWLQLADAFGTRSRAVITTFLAQLEALCGKSHWDVDAKQWRLDENVMSAALAMVNTIKPRDEIEAALAAQMVAVHLMTMKVAARALYYDHDTRTAAVAAKLARTYTIQMEALCANRTKRTTARQSIKVLKETHQHVDYHPGGTMKPTDKPMDGKPMDGKPRLLTNAPLCQARTRVGGLCRCPAVRGKARCRVRGGAKGSGAPNGERNGMWKHGSYTTEAKALRRAASQLMRKVQETKRPESGSA